MGGIPVMRVESRDPARPQSSPKGQPQISPHKRTGMCIGLNMLPASGMEWNSMGRTTHNAVHTAVIMERFTEDIFGIGYSSLI